MVCMCHGTWMLGEVVAALGFVIVLSFTSVYNVCVCLYTPPFIDYHIWTYLSLRSQESHEQYSGPKVTSAISSTVTLCPSNKPRPQAFRQSRTISEQIYNVVYIHVIYCNINSSLHSLFSSLITAACQETYV